MFCFMGISVSTEVYSSNLVKKQSNLVWIFEALNLYGNFRKNQ